jgi:hypothetical protein
LGLCRSASPLRLALVSAGPTNGRAVLGCCAFPPFVIILAMGHRQHLARFPFSFFFLVSVFSASPASQSPFSPPRCVSGTDTGRSSPNSTQAKPSAERDDTDTTIPILPSCDCDLIRTGPRRLSTLSQNSTWQSTYGRRHRRRVSTYLHSRRCGSSYFWWRIRW